MISKRCFYTLLRFLDKSYLYMTMTQQKVQGIEQTFCKAKFVYNCCENVTLLRHLIPDLANMALEYCWPVNIGTIYNLCFYGNYERISTLKNDYWDDGLRGACRGGHMDIVKLMIEKGATDWNNGLYYACREGHVNIIKLMIERGATDWNHGLRGACRGRHMDLVQLMIEKGATDWNWGLCGACEGGHMDIVKLMIEKGATDWNWGLRDACRGGHADIAKLMIEKGATGR